MVTHAYSQAGTYTVKLTVTDDLGAQGFTSKDVVVGEGQDTTPPALIQDFQATDGEDGKSTLTWTNPPDADLAEVVVRRKTDGYPADHTDGDLIYQDTSPASGHAVSHTDTGLTNGTTYYYAVFSRDAAGNWNDEVVEGKNADTAQVGAITELRIGLLVIEADHIVQEGPDLWRASGNVVVNGLLHCSGELVADFAELTVEGSGRVWLEGIPFVGDVTLYEAETYVLDASEAKLLLSEGLNTLLELASLDYGLVSFVFIEGGIEVAGNLKLPPNVGGGEVRADIRITTTAGIELVEGEINIESLSLFGFTLKDVHIVYDSEEDRFFGSASLEIPTLFELEGEIELLQGMLNEVGVGLDDLNIPIDELPVFLQRIYGEVGGLVYGPVYFEGEADFTGGPEVGDYYAIKASVSIYIDETGYLRGEGEIFVLTDEAKMARGMVEIGREGLYIEGDLVILGILWAEARARLTQDNHLYGYFRGEVRTPDDWPWPFGGHKFVGVGIYLKDTALAFELTFDWFSLSVVYEEGCDCSLARWGNFCFFCDLTPYRNIRGSVLRTSQAAGPLVEGVAVPEGADFVVFRLDWERGIARFHLVDPEGNVITSQMALANPDRYFYGINDLNLQGGFIVRDPEPGEWQFVIENPNEIGEYAFQALGANEKPSGRIIEPSSDIVASGEVVIRWEAHDPDDDAVVGIYYDTDREGADGIPIKLGLSEGNGPFQLTWDTSSLPSGRYYIYAVIDDGKHIPTVVYSAGAVEVENLEAPRPPLDLTASVTDNTIHLSWAPNPANGDVQGYAVYWAKYQHAETFEKRVFVGNVTEYDLEGLEEGYVYKCTVTTVDREGRESLFAEPILVPFGTTLGNHPPQIVSLPSGTVQPGSLFTGQVEAIDVDGDWLIFSLVDGSSGAVLDPDTGSFYWIPSSQQVGTHRFEVQVRDEWGATDTGEFFVEVVGCETLQTSLDVPKWHMIALPGELCGECSAEQAGWGNLCCALSDDVTPLYIYRWLPGRGYVGVPPCENVDYRAGMGFWLYVPQGTTLDVEVEPATGPVEVPLEQGWNQLGNPFDIPIYVGAFSVERGGTTLPLEQAVAQGWVSGFMYTYDPSGGGYVTVGPTGCIPEWAAFWFKANVDGCTLVLEEADCPPPPPASGRGLLGASESELPPPLPTLPSLAGQLQVVPVPNPVRDVNTTTFRVLGICPCEVQALRVEIYDTAGNLVWEGEDEAAELTWHTENLEGLPLANGVYLYKAYVKVNGEWIPASVQKVAVYR